jgi:hypothetical protein
MRPRSKAALVLAALLAAAALVATACGEEEELDVVEGEPVELGDVEYNVQITRFLNPTDSEDGAYLEDQPELENGEAWLAVFMTIANDGDEPVTLPAEFEIVDTRDNVYTSVESENPFALNPGSELAAGEELPPPDSPAGSGPIKGAMVLFRVDEAVTENRPLELEIRTPEETGRVELDI